MEFANLNFIGDHDRIGILACVLTACIIHKDLLCTEAESCYVTFTFIFRFTLAFSFTFEFTFVFTNSFTNSVTSSRLHGHAYSRNHDSLSRYTSSPALVVSYNSASISDELQAPTQDLKKGGSVAKLMSNAHAPSWQRNHNSTIHRSEE